MRTGKNNSDTHCKFKKATCAHENEKQPYWKDNFIRITNKREFELQINEKNAIQIS